MLTPKILEQAKRLLTLPGVELKVDAQYDLHTDGGYLPAGQDGLVRGDTHFVPCSVTDPRAQTFTLYLSNPGGLSPDDELELSYINAEMWDHTFPRLYDAVVEAERVFGPDVCKETQALQRHRIYFRAASQLTEIITGFLTQEEFGTPEADMEADLFVSTLQLARGLLQIIPPYNSRGEPMQEIDVDAAYLFRDRTVARLQNAVQEWDLRVAAMAADEKAAGLE